MQQDEADFEKESTNYWLLYLNGLFSLYGILLRKDSWEADESSCISHEVSTQFQRVGAFQGYCDHDIVLLEEEDDTLILPGWVSDTWKQETICIV